MWQDIFTSKVCCMLAFIMIKSSTQPCCLCAPNVQTIFAIPLSAHLFHPSPLCLTAEPHASKKVSSGLTPQSLGEPRHFGPKLLICSISHWNLFWYTKSIFLHVELRVQVPEVQHRVPSQDCPRRSYAVQNVYEHAAGRGVLSCNQCLQVNNLESIFLI